MAHENTTFYTSIVKTRNLIGETTLILSFSRIFWFSVRSIPHQITNKLLSTRLHDLSVSILEWFNHLSKLCLMFYFRLGSDKLWLNFDKVRWEISKKIDVTMLLNSTTFDDDGFFGKKNECDCMVSKANFK